MGCCGSKEAGASGGRGGMGHEMRSDAGVDWPTFKLLLLGSGESGKSTFFKRLLIKYKMGYEDPEDRKEFIESIHENTMESIKTLIRESRKYEDRLEYKLSDEIAGSIEVLDQCPNDHVVTPDIAQHIKTVWADAAIKQVFEQRASFQVPDSASFFFENVDEIGQDGYVPTVEHILRCRDRTTGVTHEELQIKELQAAFDIYDVGGQRSERRNWVRIFQDVKAVLFVVAISEYDQLCFEDDETNRLDDALQVFKMVVTSKHFEDTPIVLLFNKIDLFKEKLARDIPFRFESYNGHQTYEAITEFIKSKFELQNTTNNRVVTRFVSALSPDFDFKDVFKVVVDHAQH